MSEVSVRSEDHAKLRHKRITGSRIRKIMLGGPAAWDTLSAQLHNPEAEVFYTPEMSPNMPEQLKRGHSYEPQARAEFMLRHPEFELERPVFCVPDEEMEDAELTEWIGMSPDGILNHVPFDPNLDSGLETKVPAIETHMEWVSQGLLPPEYLPQCAISLLVTGRSSWWFCSFCPEKDEDDPERYFEVVLYRQQAEIYLGVMRERIHEFLEGHIKYQIFNKLPTQEAGAFPIINWEVNDAAIKVLIEQYSKLGDPKNSMEYAVVKSAHKDMVTRRTGIDKAYKAATEEAKTYVSGAKAEQKRLQGLMAEIEAELKKKKEDWEAEQARIKQEAEDKEKNRVEAISTAMDQINNSINLLPGCTSIEISKHIDAFEEIEVTEVIFQESFVEAQNAKVALITRAQGILKEVHDKEVADENARIEQEEQAERLKKLEDEKKETKRVTDIRDRIVRIQQSVLECLSADLDTAKKTLLKLEAVDLEEGFDEFKDEAKRVLTESINQVKSLVDQKAEAARLLEESKKITAEELEAPAKNSAEFVAIPATGASTESPEREMVDQEAIIEHWAGSIKYLIDNAPPDVPDAVEYLILAVESCREAVAVP